MDTHYIDIDCQTCFVLGCSSLTR